ncbi:hypothetical protein AWB80_07555 [Caballeronia pedi]|uniref:DUF4376 domain-containing protein n=1 Tax=Caballeronia pedi TaxID=1777141 RepID=A0A158DXZ1_9BURK|nr:DUF4376 domain-containing protein [Caballeronia pedi]SAK98587.1 hypothetical protein AWB80_07555 [Caballeronia pedi]
MGQKQAAFNESGAIFAFYDTMDSPAPEGVAVIDLTDAEWQFCSDNQGSKIVSNGVLADAPPVDPTLMLATAKASVKAQIRDHRDDLLLLTPFNGKSFQTDIASKIQIMNVVDAGSLPAYATYWRTADNSYMTMTFDLFVQLKTAIMVREGAAFGASAQHQDAVDAKTSADAVNAYDWSTGWPA